MQIDNFHNPDRYMNDLRQILAQGRKRIGLMIGAGAPTSIRVNENNLIVEDGDPLVPDVSGLTDSVVNALDENDQHVIKVIESEIGDSANIEAILTRVRQLSLAIGNSQIHGLNGSAYSELGKRICKRIGSDVSVSLPAGRNPYTELISWISGTRREHAVEIFTPNYDLLVEEAFERHQVPYFDGFTGSHLPFFDPASVSSDELPSRWSRLWKLHGSLGWKRVDGTVVRTGKRTATELIYPDHLKFDEVTRLPYSALFERLRRFLTTSDTLLICSGFSFLDAHICAVLDEALAANAHTAIFAFQFRPLENEQSATRLAFSRPNMSIYARDGAVINGVAGRWQLGEAPSEDWREIRKTYWRVNEPAEFLLGDFDKLARFLALTQAQEMLSPALQQEDEVSNESDESRDTSEDTDVES